MSKKHHSRVGHLVQAMRCPSTLSNHQDTDGEYNGLNDIPQKDISMPYPPKLIKRVPANIMKDTEMRSFWATQEDP